MKKIGKMNELMWIFGVIIIAFSVALTSKAGFGVSMVVAPAYGIHLFVSQYLPWYSFGTSEYIFQGFLIIIMCLIIGKFKWKYLLSFGTAVIYGLLLDFFLFLLGGSGAYEGMAMRIFALIAGLCLTSLSVAMFFRTYLPLQVYEMFVTVVSREKGIKNVKMKYIYDFSSLGLAAILALIFSLKSDGIKFTDCIGLCTVIAAVVNGFLIDMFGKILDKIFTFEPALPKLEEKIKY